MKDRVWRNRKEVGHELEMYERVASRRQIMEVKRTGTSLTEKPLKALCRMYSKGFLNYWHLVLESPLREGRCQLQPSPVVATKNVRIHHHIYLEENLAPNQEALGKHKEI